MSSFLPEFLERQPITVQLLSTCRAIGEFKGTQQLFAQQSPERLEQLRQVAVIQSTESSNRIEGVIAPLRRIEALVVLGINKGTIVPEVGSRCTTIRESGNSPLICAA